MRTNKYSLYVASLVAITLGLWFFSSRNHKSASLPNETRAWTDEEIQQAAIAASRSPSGFRQDVADLLGGVTQVQRKPMLGSIPYLLNPSVQGSLRFVGMEPGWSLGNLPQTADIAKASSDFVLEHRSAFDLENPRVGLSVLRHRVLQDRHVVRLQQTYGGLPVFAAQAVVHSSLAGQVTSVLLDPGFNFTSLDASTLPLSPKIDEDQAFENAFTQVQKANVWLDRETVRKPAATLMIYSPEVLGFEGEAELAWEMTLESTGMDPKPVAVQILVSANDGAVINSFQKTHTALTRRVYDAALTVNAPTTPTRDNGGAAVNIAEVDQTYDFLGQIWNFYFQVHGRDSYNNAGANIEAIVRLRQAVPPTVPPTVPTPPPIPLRNAFSGAGFGPMTFGEGFTTDDIVAHEFTHRVTEWESGLLYQNASGAINESFSDIWGEAFDQWLQPDIAAEIWLMGEDIPLAAGSTVPNTPLNRALRSMINPPAKGDPDSLRSTLYRPHSTYPRGSGPANNDVGGVHSNSGVCNRLFTLLVLGGSLNGYTVAGIGLIDQQPLDLFYEVQTNSLTPASDWRDLNFALRQASATLDFDTWRRLQVDLACNAVDILGIAKRVVCMDAATNAPVKTGIPEVSGDQGPYNDLFFAQLNAAGGTVKINGQSGRIVVPQNYIISIPSTLTTYDTFIQVNPGPPATGTPIPPAAVVIGNTP